MNSPNIPATDGQHTTGIRPAMRIPWDDYEGRIRLALEGRADVDCIPAVEHAGHVVDRNGKDWQIMFNGLRMRAGGYYGAWMSELIRKLGGFHEPQEERVFHHVLGTLQKPSAMLELGAYWAWYSLWFKSSFPDATVVAVEPDPGNLAIAAENAAENGLDIVMELGGVSRTSDGKRTNSTFPIKPFCHVPHVRVGAVMERYELDRLDMLHADIQGAELAMLQESVNLLERRLIDHLFISTHGETIHQDCRKLLDELGYRMIAEHTPSQSYSFDGLLCARSPDLPELHVDISVRNIT